ncbi:unnamed protein product [Haemonchus placei]|uniref:Secreted protein n=1 Tax=Haemonchus placei TaxID=6290 RepID=A0A0N4VUF7_HAEPC|nr:unnamed protein product [Haemonchus placei]
MGGAADRQSGPPSVPSVRVCVVLVLACDVLSRCCCPKRDQDNHLSGHGLETWRMWGTPLCFTR